jgi:hypothetical protein
MHQILPVNSLLLKRKRLCKKKKTRKTKHSKKRGGCGRRRK